MTHLERTSRDSSKQAKELDVRIVAMLWLMVGGICVVLANALAAGLA